MGSLRNSSCSGDISKPHAVCIPYPAQGHINPMNKLARLLHHRGFHITFVHTDYNYSRLVRSRGPSSVSGLPSFRITSIPDGLPPTDADATQDIPALCDSVDRNCAAPFKELLLKLANNKDDPPVSCVVSDGVMPFTLDVTEELGILNVLFWTASANGLLGYAQYRSLIEKGIIPLKDTSCFTNGYLDTTIEWVPEALKGIQLRDIPSFIRTTDRNDIMLNYLMSCVERSSRAAAIIFNTYDALEGQFLSTLPSSTPASSSSSSSSYPPFYTCGPFPLLLDQIKDVDRTLSIQSSLWQDDDKSIDWLDSKDPESVVYVNFGSITVMTNDQLIEFAWGLANCGKPFLWVIRPDLVSGDSAVLPPEFISESGHRGLLASWCDQERVLKHPSVSVFLTHSGWNSTLESLINGVPMICWPFFAEQQTNCWYVRQLGIGMEVDANVKRNGIRKQVNELMDNGEKGLEIKKKAKEWKKLTHEALEGSLFNFHKLVNQVLKPAKAGA